MVVIMEGFPSKKEFITKYLDKKRQQIEIMSQRKFRTSSVPQRGEIITPFDFSQAEMNEQNIEKSVKSGGLETPQIIQLNDEPLFVKNFNEFIRKTNFHLDQLLSNSRKINDDMIEIKKDVDVAPAAGIDSQNPKDDFKTECGDQCVVSDVEEEILTQNHKDLKKVNELRPAKDAIPKTGRRDSRLGGGLTNSKPCDMRESPKSRSDRSDRFLGKGPSSAGKPMTAGTCKPPERTYSRRPMSYEPRRTPRSSRTPLSFEKRLAPPLAKETSSNCFVPPLAKGRVLNKIPVSIINLELM